MPLSLAALYFAARSDSAPENLKPFSVQMHLHGPMSEGPGSMRAANVQAKKIGLDVLWWTEHDWRMAYHTYADGYDFEADDLNATRPVPLLPPGAAGSEMQIDLSPHPSNSLVSNGVARISNERASEGRRSLEISATGSPGVTGGEASIPDPNDDGERRARGRKAPQSVGPYGTYFYTIDATRRRMKRALASDVTVQISIWPDFDADANRMAAVRIDLSQQPPDMQQGAILYVLTGVGDADLHKLESEHRKIVRLPFKPREWNRYTLHLTDDARRLGLGGGDNSLVDASFGVLTNGPRTHAFFDQYRISHTVQSEALREQGRRMAAALQAEFGVVNHVSQEISYQAHLNPFGARVPMIDYTAHPTGLTPRETVEFVHRNGGIVSLNHIYGTSRAPKNVDINDPESARKYEDKQIAKLLAERAYGADILEVGYPVRVLPMMSFLRAWDALSKAGVYMTGDGVSDTHTSNGGWFNGNNFVTWVWARSTSVEDLVDGLRRGAAYFGDPVNYHGTLNVTTDDGHRMGQVVIAHKPKHSITISISGLPPGARIRTVNSGSYGAEFTSETGKFERQVEAGTGAQSFFRVEVYSHEGKPLVFSNPIYFRPDDAGDISAFRRAVCK